MTRYQYLPLQDPQRDIRLVTLLPGIFDDDIQVCIKHVPLIPQPKASSEISRLTINELQATLPKAWNVFETREGRILFQNWESVEKITSWTHPDSSVDKQLYDGLEERPISSVFFEALSYTWGPEENPETILVLPYDLPEEKRLHHFSVRSLQIRRNLAVALRLFRNEKQPRTFWIDSICLNQEDLVERSEQVRRMVEIYTLAPRVVIWLGEGSEDSKLALSTLENIGNQVQTVSTWETVRHPEATDPDIFNFEVPLPYDDKVWNAIRGILDRPYFTRLWIWQEAILGDTRSVAQCGADEVEWPIFRGGLYRIFNIQSNAPDDIKNQYKQAKALVAGTDNQALWTLMSDTRFQICSDARDKVFGILGVAQSNVRERIRIDYTLPVGKVMRDTFLTICDEYSSIDILRHCDVETKLKDAPSWVPSWSPQSVNGQWTSTDYISFCMTDLDVEFQKPDRLNVWGVYCGVLEFVSDYVVDDFPSLEGIKKLCSCIPMDAEQIEYVSGQHLSDAYGTVLCAGRLREHYGFSNGHPTFEQARTSFTMYFGGLHAKRSMTDRDVQSDLYLKQVFEASGGHVLLRTKEGHIGIGPPTARSGDEVCFLYGCNVPMLLRRQAHTGYYQVIGALYMHGLMHGEAYLGPLPTPWHMQVFRIQSTDYLAFRNAITEQTTFEDPRLPKLPPGWRMSPWDENYEAAGFDFEEIETGTFTTQDPRTSIQALSERGVQSQKFTLV